LFYKDLNLFGKFIFFIFIWLKQVFRSLQSYFVLQRFKFIWEVYFLEVYKVVLFYKVLNLFEKFIFLEVYKVVLFYKVLNLFGKFIFTNIPA